jgi:hypothetical protein
VTFGIALIRSGDGDVTVAAQFWQMVAAGFVVMAAYGVIGVALGALVRNQIAAVGGVLVWMLTVEQIVGPWGMLPWPFGPTSRGRRRAGPAAWVLASCSAGDGCL